MPMISIISFIRLLTWFPLSLFLCMNRSQICDFRKNWKTQKCILSVRQNVLRKHICPQNDVHNFVHSETVFHIFIYLMHIHQIYIHKYYVTHCDYFLIRVCDTCPHLSFSSSLRLRLGNPHFSMSNEHSNEWSSFIHLISDSKVLYFNLWSSICKLTYFF